MPRKSALKILLNIFEDKAYSDIALNTALQESKLDDRDKSLVTNLVYGVVQNLAYLDYQIQESSNIKLKKISSVILNILRLSIYQLHFLDKIPESAAVNEGVKLAKKFSHAKTAGFVNAILRNVIRKGKVLPSKENIEKYFSVLYSYPIWMVNMWIKEFGQEECERLLTAGNQKPPLTVRVNTYKTTVDNVKTLLNAEDGIVQGSLNVNERGSVTDLSGFREGLFTVQDAASQMAVIALSPKEGEKVLDVCAAPGGKTTHIAELMKNSGSVIAWDIHPHKINLIKNTAYRLGLTNIETYTHDAKNPKLELENKMDRVLVDAPCSGLGIIRKKPDIKWLRMEKDIKELCEEQLKILLSASTHLKKGGTLVYSTCTICKAENEGVVNEFLKQRTYFKLACDPKTLYPHIDNTDGFFICTLKRCE